MSNFANFGREKFKQKSLKMFMFLNAIALSLPSTWSVPNPNLKLFEFIDM